MMNVDKCGRDEGGGEEPFGELGREGGALSEASWISASAVTAFATTCHQLASQLRGMRDLPLDYHPQ
jgi:hypothetical protein